MDNFTIMCIQAIALTVWFLLGMVTGITMEKNRQFEKERKQEERMKKGEA